MSNEVTTTTEQNEVTQALLLDYLKTMNKGLNEQQTKQFLAVAGTFGLNPWKREVYAVTYKNKDGSTDMSIVTGYETYIKRAEMNPNYDGYDIKFNGTFKKGTVTKSGKNGAWQVEAIIPEGDVSCTCTVYRKDRAHPIVEEVFFDEYNQNNSMWQSKPRTMLKKVAIVSAFRKAFPIDFGGMPYTNDELPDNMTGADKLQAQGMQEVQPEQPTTAQPESPKPKAEKKILDEKTKEFLNGMGGFYQTNAKIYIDTMKSYGYDKAMNIPVENRDEVFKAIQDKITMAAQQHFSAPTAQEQAESADF